MRQFQGNNPSGQPSNQAMNGFLKGKGDGRCSDNDGKLVSATGLALLPVKVKAPDLQHRCERGFA